MTDAANDPATRDDRDMGLSIFAFGSVLLRRRKMIVISAVLGTALGVTLGLSKEATYTSSATFIPQGAEGASSELALAASQFGVRVPSAGAEWGAPIYMQVLTSQAVLEPIALDTVRVSEKGGRLVPLMELLKIPPGPHPLRTHLAVRRLRGMISTAEEKRVGSVAVTVASAWPSVSLWIAEQLVAGVDRFNLQLRKSQAAEERRFVETQVVSAEHALRAAEDRLQSFLKQNRDLASPELQIHRDRLGRDIALRQQVYTSLVQNREEARIREVRDTPVINVLDAPRLPVVRQSRGTAKLAILSGLVFGLAAVALAFLLEGIANAQRRPHEDSREFFDLWNQAATRFVRRV